MKATKQFYLKYRSIFLTLGLLEQVDKLDVHFNIYKLYDKKGLLIKIW